MAKRDKLPKTMATMEAHIDMIDKRNQEERERQRRIRTGAVITVVGVSCIGLGIYAAHRHHQKKNSE